MRKSLLVAATLLFLGYSSPLFAQTVAEQKSQADLDKVLADIAKVKVETRVANETGNRALLAPLASMQGDTASISNGEKTAEAMMLNRAVVVGLATKIVESALAGEKVTPGMAAPIILFAEGPPDVSALVAFNADYIAIGRRLSENIKKYDSGAQKSAVAATTIIAVVTTAVALLRTETSITGASFDPSTPALVTALQRALKLKGYEIDNSLFDMPDGEAEADAMMAGLNEDRDKAKMIVQLHQIKVAAEDRVKPDQNDVVAELTAALIEYQTLDKALRTATDGVYLSTTINRQRRLASARSRLYVLNKSGAFTSITKKGFFAGSEPAYFASAAVADWAYIDDAGRVPITRGSLDCRRKLKFSEAAKLTAAGIDTLGTANCDSPVPKG